VLETLEYPRATSRSIDPDLFAALSVSMPPKISGNVVILNPDGSRQVIPINQLTPQQQQQFRMYQLVSKMQC